MTFAGWIEILLVLTLVLGAAWPLGAFMADVFDGRRSVHSPVVGHSNAALAASYPSRPLPAGSPSRRKSGSRQARLLRTPCFSLSPISPSCLPSRCYSASLSIRSALWPSMRS